MFRRKEESMFDTAVDATQGALPGTATQAAPAQAAAQPQAMPAATAAASAPSSIYQPQASTPLRQVGEPVRQPAAAQATASAFRPAAATQPETPSRPRPIEMKPAAPMAAPASVLNSALTPAGADKSAKSSRRILTVGHDILLKGEIATCDRLVIEGKVDATISDVHTIEISEVGSFKGVAQVEDAEINGVFEGELIVKNRLVIYSTGRVRGKITYGEIEIERGGELTGEIKTPASIASSSSASAASTPRAARSASSSEAREKKEDKVAA